MSDQARAASPIGVFDSGIGGLTVLHELLVSLPEEDYLYLGDSANFPYGDKDAGALRDCAGQNTELLLRQGAKLVVIACNSAAAAGLDRARAVADRHRVPVIGVIEPEAEIAAAITVTGRVGVLATAATVAAGAYGRALRRQLAGIEVVEVAAPDLAPIIQNGFPFDEHVVETVRAYCEPLKRAAVDTVVLGCTHFPLVAPMLQRILGRDVRLVTAGHAIAATAQRVLESRGIAARRRGEGTYRFICTGETESFRRLGTRFLQMPIQEVERAPVGSADRGPGHHYP